ncbi:wax ester/triacylglycerol synthase family O-acyltransferase [Nocardioides sp. zg-536]|uniref:Diacylglycerol O-acyltransferase n=1 Tax=Nocardioides faecalis TaxID=2803858 RepID=A0A939BZW6_9ACTN|nr:wax ester/triacylglycerol synthase family O-acyltransferase [Nocardioides faecalis]MBM9461500.1 wax ester/triacylglycerol synthase family O-acyltransferase [Nocardioides faecalis]MBS4752590.1 wax ester/triacylglycerol synthase family O-acyltransferase [Nocardioides faecalis]QVI57869.1 wax ester/triacylglycerol synthase family O-acyltransferase [Nocardioides faecalis]
MDRVRPRDAVFLAEESPQTPLHNVTIEVFDPGTGPDALDHARLVRLVRDRIAFVPRYRQRVLTVPGNLAAPVWVDDENFDLGYHVRRSALPRPGTREQLLELAGRIVSRPLDRSRPLWEIYFVEGLESGRVALLSKTHQALVDGVHTVDLGQLLLDLHPESRELDPDDWAPRPAPSSAAVLASAVKENLTDPLAALDTARSGSQAVLRAAGHGSARARGLLAAATGRSPQRNGVINGPLSQQRRIVAVQTRLDDYRQVRDAHGGTINDVILATLSGALRAWLMTRAESLGGLRQVRAVVPVSVIDEELEATSLGSQIAAHFVDLPVGEQSPVVRLHQVSYSFQAHKDTGRSVAANRLAGLAGFAPTTFHAIGSRVAATELRRGYHLSVTNVPGPQAPLYAAGARMVASYPVPPLVPGHPLAIGVTSYDGGVFYGITADRDWIPDADLLGVCVREALDELLELSSETRQRAPRGRRGARAARPRTRGRGGADGSSRPD